MQHKCNFQSFFISVKTSWRSKGVLFSHFYFSVSVSQSHILFYFSAELFWNVQSLLCPRRVCFLLDFIFTSAGELLAYHCVAETVNPAQCDSLQPSPALLRSNSNNRRATLRVKKLSSWSWVTVETDCVSGGDSCSQLLRPQTKTSSSWNYSTDECLCTVRVGSLWTFVLVISFVVFCLFAFTNSLLCRMVINSDTGIKRSHQTEISQIEFISFLT